MNTIKSIFPNKSKASSPSAENTNQRANNFVRYFSTVVSVLKKSVYPLIDFVWRYPMKSKLRTKSIFTFAYVSSVFVEKELRNLKRNKSAGADCLPPNLLKGCAREIASPISFIINKSLETSTVPNGWKIAKIFPIFKSGKTELVENYRPISVLPVLSKILEKCVHKQMYDYLESNNLLSDCQYGFRKKRSTKLATTLFCDTIRKKLTEAKWSVVSFSTYQKLLTPLVTARC